MGHDPHQSPSHKIKHILFFLFLYFSWNFGHAERAGVLCGLEESSCSFSSCCSKDKLLPLQHSRVHPSCVEQSSLQRHFYHKSDSRLDLQFDKSSFMIKNDKHCVSLANVSDRMSHFWKSFGTLDIWLDCSFRAHLLCALSSAWHQCTYCSFHRKLSLQRTYVTMNSNENQSHQGKGQILLRFQAITG